MIRAMTRYCSDLTRHMRLFELIRQQNLAALRASARPGHIGQLSQANSDRLVAQAVRSLGHPGYAA